MENFYNKNTFLDIITSLSRTKAEPIAFPLVLYFYPKDNTPGCTQESEEFAQLYTEFTQQGVQILGVSRDTLSSHEKFSTKLNLPFALVSDKEEQLCQYFDVIKQKNMYGKQVRGIERSTFLFDKNGNLFHSWRKVKAAGHAKEVLMHVQNMYSENNKTNNTESQHF